LPWEALRHVLVCFQRLFERQIVSPHSWRRILVSFMLKGPKARSFDETRALAMLSVFGKWFSCCLTILLEAHIRTVAPRGCQLYGFVVGHKCYEITAPLKHLARHAVLWKEEDCHIVSCDIKQAFDYLTVRSAVDSLLELGVDASLVYAVFEGYAHNVAELSFQQCTVEDIRWDSCIRTGSMEAPALWVAKSLCILSPVVARWRDRGYGVQLSIEASKLHVNHWLWADNVILAASRREDMLAMLTDLTGEIHRHGFEWKRNSLEYLACGCPGPPRSLQFSVQDLSSSEGITYEVPQVTRMIVLGTLLDTEFSDHADISHRLSAARKAFWTDGDLYTNPVIPMSRKLARYDSRVRSSFLYGVEGSNCDVNSLTRIHVEEGKFLSMMYRRRKKTNETWGDYWSARIRHARLLLLNSSRPSLVQLTLYRQWLFAKHVVCTAHGSLARPEHDELSHGILYREPVEPNVLCGSSVEPMGPDVLSAPAPPRNRRQQIGEMYRNVRQRRDAPLPSEPQPAPQPIRKRARHDYTSTWATPAMQSALCMLHASGEFTEHRDAMVLSFGMQGRAHSRRRSTRVVQSLQPWFTLFEVTQGLHWDQSMCWTEMGWKNFLVGTLQQLELTKILEFCLIKDASSGIHRKEEEGMKTEAELQRENDRLAKRLAALFDDETSWRMSRDWLALEMRGDSQCVTRWLTGKNKCLNQIYSRTIANMQNQLYSICNQFKIYSPESGRDIWKWVYREGNGEADHETHVAREGLATTDVRWDYNTLNSICMGHYSVHAVRGSFDGGRCELGTSCGWVIDIFISSNLSSSSLPPGLPPNRWHPGVARRAFMIPSHCTVTQAELAASQSLLSGVVDLCTYIYS